MTNDIDTRIASAREILLDLSLPLANEGLIRLARLLGPGSLDDGSAS